MIRIVGGIESTPNSWPWQAFLTDDRFMCSASLINNYWLVTAAHCVDGYDFIIILSYVSIDL